MAIGSSQTNVHRVESERSHRDKDPKGIDQVNLEPEGNNNCHNSQIVKCKQASRERHIGEISPSRVHVVEEVQEQEAEDSCNCEGHDW